MEAVEEVHESRQEGADICRGLDPSVDISSFPSSYTHNSPEEQTLLDLAENFCRQYSLLYPHRKPLFISPQNECGVKKFVCSTLRPTLLPYPLLYQWDECAHFVSEFITMRPLNSANKLPHCLSSSFSVLREQRGSCFDFSVLLCSLLLGAGYDAYCVSGYATRKMCLMDEREEAWPLLKTPQESCGSSPLKSPQKYSVRPPRQLLSKYELQQKVKKEAKKQAANQRQQEEEDRRLAEAENPGPDPLYGCRVHCWVLVLASKREVPDNFFIDALTGRAFQTKDPHFLDIESLWNHENYWVNMQDCRNGCKDITFDLGDPLCWEFMLLSTAKPVLLIPNMKEEDEEDEGDQDQVMSQVPVSWVLPIVVTPEAFEMRCPEGMKLLQYKKARLEKWAPYLQDDGRVSRLTLYQDTASTIELEVQDLFENRKDKLDMRQVKRLAGDSSEYFSPGRKDALKAHTFRSLTPETERTMVFYSEARLDGLQRREERPKEMLENFHNREDLLYYRHTTYGKRAKKVSIAGGPTEVNPRPILKILERFHRNSSKAANEDVAERIFLIAEGRIHVRCHRQDDHITTSTWDFLKPANLGEKGAHVVLSPETCVSYQVEPLEKFTKQLYVYETLVHLQQGEQCAQEAVRRAEAELLEILYRRAQEEAEPQLIISIFDTERNRSSQEQRTMQQRAAQQEQERRAELCRDYLAPYLAPVGDPEKLTRLQAQQVKDDCLRDLKNRLVQQANLIQARFEKETQELQKKQQWYHQNQPSMTREDEEAYLEFCSEAMFQIQILETRLNRHKRLAPQKFQALEDRLNKDPRLNEQLLPP
ncbi:dynein regulatory complex subunit 7 [Ranitomeya imitator]|uniref:dynein regulatory complex subunit 7 n=1 Tax=Ranitomeya imitator TaxID=111125 RepID=UPI0037E90F15